MKDRIYKSNNTLIITYATAQPDTEGAKIMLEKAELKTLRKIDGKTLWSRAGSTDIRRSCKVENINNGVRNRRVEWKGHISRMITNRVIRMVRDGSSIRRPSVGIPGKFTGGTLKKQTRACLHYTKRSITYF
uniref:Uncharacterized protein LOC114335532 n=1 Tax=Diabrotica virgifera virgifera TaxID=50390 RepID=A0A6P7FYK5_DIAVI